MDIPQPTTELTPNHKSDALLAALGKHANELLALEDSQQKLVVVLLGIFSVGIGSLEKLKPLPAPALIFVALALLAFGALYTSRRSAARKAIRSTIVDIECALGFYTDGLYLQGRSLYPKEFLQFPEKSWLEWIYWTVIIVGIAFIVLVCLR